MIAGVAPDDLADGDVIAVAHKVVSKSEGATRRLSAIEPGRQARALAAKHEGKDARLVQAVLDEAEELLRADRGVLVCVTRHGLVCANAGVDQSNAPDGEVILLPADPDDSARRLRDGIHATRGVRPAVIVTDSFGRAWRMGETDVALGAAGIAPLDHWQGRTDAFGRELRVTSIAVADSAAGAADLARSKDSRQPAVLIRGLERYVTADDGPGAAALRRPAADDLFRS